MVLLAVGFNLARHKPLWTDEIYSQTVSVEKFSYPEILLGKVNEGNTCPLFYLIQKMICDVTQFKTAPSGSEPWDHRAQILLRVSPVFFMSLSITGIFYYFFRFYSFWAGVYSLFIALSTPMVWLYWAESRPYALWFFLTTVQSLLFLVIVRGKDPNPRAWNWLVIVHWLLSLTVITSFGQVIVVSSLLWAFKEKRLKKQICLSVLPVFICCYYYFFSSLSSLWVPDNFMKLIYPSLSVQQIGLIAIYIFFSFVYYSRVRDVQNFPIIIREGRNYLALTILMFIVAFAYLVFYKLRETTGHAGHELPVRQFIFLAPVGIIATVLFSLELIRVVKNHPWLQVNVILAFSGLMVVHFLRNGFSIIGIY